jgi:hypothetical protein
MEEAVVVIIEEPEPPAGPPEPVNKNKFQYLYLLRVPIMTAAMLVLLPIISLFAFRELLGNLFVLDVWNIFWTMIVATMVALSVLVSTRVVLLNGSRFGVAQGLDKDVVPGWALFAAELLVVPLALAAIFGIGQAPIFSKSGTAAWDAFLHRFGAAAGGVFTALALSFLTLVAAILFSQRYVAPDGQPMRAGDRYPGFKWMKWLLNEAYAGDIVSQERRDKLGAWGKSLPKPFQAGYFDPTTGLLYPGQWLTFLLLLCSFGVYWFIGFFKQARLGEHSSVPAIAYVLLLLLNLNWMLSVAAFFLDRYRIPLLTLIVLLALPGNFLQRSDHYYTVSSGVAVKAINPARVIMVPRRAAADALEPRGRIVVIATAGGGIQAAAWTAQVLTGIQRELHKQYPDKPVNFADSIAMISSVSGGAVGTMFFMNRYEDRYDQQGFTAPDDALPKIVQQAEAPGLEDVAWALVYSDFWRAFFPYAKRGTEDKLIDRGWALEQGWRNSANINAALSNWREGVEEGYRPAAIFNSTLVETGEPLLLATSDVRGGADPEPHRRTFSELYPNRDIPVVTAVRLAATFPFVTPVARAVSDRPEYHVADGGYYDNYGVYNLIEWLEDALAGVPAAKIPDILIVQIRSFPAGEDAMATNKGWFYQTYAPVSALMNVRTAGQLVRDRDALTAFDQRWSGKGFRIAHATFQFEGNDAPLSWAMNQSQIQDISREWDKSVNGLDNQDWLQVSCFFHPDSGDCAKLARFGRKGPW